MASAAEHLHKHKPAIVVTNACNRRCGGCLQLCGHFPADKLFFLTEAQFREAIDAVILWAESAWKEMDWRSRFIPVYGGEPTIHPRWNELLRVMSEYPRYPFVVYTNGQGLGIGNPLLGNVDGACPLSPASELGPLLHLPGAGTANGRTDAEFFEELVNRERYPCLHCGGKLYQFVGVRDEGRHCDWNESLTIFYNCRGCGKLYRLQTEEGPTGFAQTTDPERMSDCYREKRRVLSRLPRNAAKRHRRLFEAMATFHEGNVGYRVAYKSDYDVRYNWPVMAAPCDLLLGGDGWWNGAQQSCFLWKHCESAIYNGRVYFCEVAAAMDWLFCDGRHGWPLERCKDPLLRSEEALTDQASRFCRRCGYAFGSTRYEAEKRIGTKQFVHQKTLATFTNYCAMPKTHAAFCLDVEAKP